MKNPVFSIVIPVKNGASTIEDTLKSIFNQSYKRFEVIVVDDNSTDASKQITKRFDCTTINLHQSYGAAYARNKGAEKAKGDVIVFTDADVLFFNNTLSEAAKYIQENPNNQVFFGLFSEKIKFQNLFSQYKHLYLCYYYSKQGEYLHTLDTSLTFIDRKLFNQFKFNSNVKISEDTELGMRLTKAGYHITQPKNINMEHIKFYSFKTFLRTDFVRGMRFSRLFLKSIFKDKKESGKKTFYLKPINIYVNIGLMPFTILFLILSLFLNKLFFITFFLLIILFIVINLEFWNFLRKQRGIFFALKSSFITFIDAFIMGLGVTLTFFNFLIKGGRILK